MNVWNYIRRSLIHHRWIHLAVLLAIATATAVLTGALLVGDSVRGSLRELGLGRLGQIDHALISPRFFGISQFDKLSEEPKFKDLATTAAPACIATSTTVESRTAEFQRANHVLLIGADERFWKLGDQKVPTQPGDREVVINAALAREVAAKVGDKITIRLPGANPVPADSPLGRKDDRVSSLVDLRIVAIVPNKGLGEFKLRPTQQTALNAWVALNTFANAVDQPDRINAILVDSASQASNSAQAAADIEQLDKLLQLEFDDFGLSLQRESRSFEEKPIWDYWHITTDRLVWDQAARDAVNAVLTDGTDGGAQEVFTYLANSIRLDYKEEVEIPYSTVTALDNHPQLGPLTDSDGQTIPALAENEVALNSWAAERLGARVGDAISIDYFAPETLHGEAEEHSVTFNLAAIVPIAEPNGEFRRARPPEFDQSPTLANDPALTPTVEGVTDQASINDWDPPFPFDSARIQPIDETYWDKHRTTPKAFISLTAGKEMWSSRLGGTTGFRVQTKEGISEEVLKTSLTTALREKQTQLGFEFQPLRSRILNASAGTTPFEFLFLGFSMFLMASALMLIAALFRLGLDLRAKEFGTLAASGMSTGKIRRLTIGELAIVALLGALIGVVGGVIYAEIMLSGLRTWWLDAIVTPFLRLHIQPMSLLLGLLLSVVAAAIVVWRGLGRLKTAAPRELLAGRFPNGAGKKTATASNLTPTKRSKPWLRILMGLAIVVGVLGTRLSGEAQAGAFFGSGALALIVLMIAIRRWLNRSGNADDGTKRLSPLSSWRLAWKNAARDPGRSTLTIALMAAASFLILAIAAFRLAPTDAGTGGFALIAKSDQPIYDNLSDDAVRTELFGSKAEALNGTDILRLRSHDGDDASCRNLYQSTRPQMLGVSDQVIDYFDNNPDRFGWAGANVEEVEGQNQSNRWRCLLGTKDDATIPVVIDKNTAMYALHLPPSVGHEFELDYGCDGPTRFRIAGLLGGTTLQGSLLLHERDLLRLFPETGGYQQFLIRVPIRDEGGDEGGDPANDVAAMLENRFGDEGLDVQKSANVLRGLLAVQNTYLSTFQSLGALGLLLGAVGLVAVQIRQVISRRSELALMSAMGMSPSWIRWQLIRENAVLLAAGLGSGILAALVALIPHQLSSAATFPLGTLLMTLAGIFIIALAAAAVAARFVLSQPVVASLRGD